MPTRSGQVCSSEAQGISGVNVCPAVGLDVTEVSVPAHVVFAADTFVIRDGKIAEHTFAPKLEPHN